MATSLSRQPPRQRLLNERTRFGNAVKRGERAEARASFLTDQHLIDHLEEGDGNARSALGALLGVILVTLDPRATLSAAFWIASPSACAGKAPSAADRLDSASRSASSGDRYPFVGFTKSSEVADRISDEPVEFRMRLRRDIRRVVGDEAPQHVRSPRSTR